MRLFGRWQGALLGSAGVLAAVCAAILPVAPRVGFALQAQTCDTVGACQAAALMTDSCTADTRSGVSGQAATPVYFEEVAPGRVGLRYFADGTAGVVARAGDGLESHRFPSGEDALRWLVARNPAESRAIDKVWGPTAEGQADAVLAGAEAVGLSPRTDSADTAAVMQVEAGEEAAVMTVGGDGTYTVHQTMALPWETSARLTGLATWMGQQSHLVIRTEYTATGRPTAVTLTGPARADWDLRVLTGTQPNARAPQSEPPRTDAFDLRSYTLDLTRQRNAQAFQEAFPSRYGAGGRTFAAPPADPYPTEAAEDGQAGVHPVEVFAQRVRADAVLVEATYESGARDAQPLTVQHVLALQTGLPTDDGAGGFAPRLQEASAMDLARPESALAPIVNCEVLDEEDLERLVDAVDAGAGE